jgi:Coenzyme PQQ synthesis protein D (PqqD)
MSTEIELIAPTHSASYRRKERLPFRRLDAETVIVNPRDREVHVLNGTGSRIWELLETAATVPELIRALEREGKFEVAALALVRDVTSFLEDLARKGLVSIETDEAAP